MEASLTLPTLPEVKLPTSSMRDRVLAKGFDYLALGDWHGTFKFDPRAWYPGAPEATRFKESEPGAVLLVEIDAAGAEPRVERIPVAQTRWLSLDLELLEDEQVAELRARLDALEERSHTLLNLKLRGAISLAARDSLDALLADYAQRLVYLRQDCRQLQHAGKGCGSGEPPRRRIHGRGPRKAARLERRDRAGCDPASLPPEPGGRG